MGKRVIIDIDLDKKCLRCGHGGAMTNGYCMRCVTKMIGEGVFDDAFKKIRDKKKRVL